MVQFVLCKKSTCPKINDCYRYRASPDIDQLYNDFINLCNEEDNYNFFIKIRPDDKIIELNNEIKAIEGGNNIADQD